MTKEEQARALAISAHQRGEKVSTIVQRLGRSRAWFYKWLKRYEGAGARGVWHEDRSKRPPGNARQVPEKVVEAVTEVRRELQRQGIFSGAQMIRWELVDRGCQPLPSLRTINRIIQREGLGQRRAGRYVPKGKLYPALAAVGANDVHQSDFVGPCYLTGGARFYSLNSVDLATARCAVTPQLNKTAQATIDGFWANWCRLGIPGHQQVDNEMVFYGSPTHPRGMGCLIRLCLAQGVEPWFIPLREPWRNGVVEKFNDHYEQGLLQRVQIDDIEALEPESLAFEERHNRHYRYSKIQGRTPMKALSEQKQELRFPASEKAPRHPLPKPENGRYHVVRFIRGEGLLDVFSEKFQMPPEASYAYVTATIDVAKQKLKLRLGKTVIDERDYRLR